MEGIRSGTTTAARTGRSTIGAGRWPVFLIAAVLGVTGLLPGFAANSEARIKTLKVADARRVAQRLIDRRADTNFHYDHQIVRCRRVSRLRVNCLAKWKFGTYQDDYCTETISIKAINDRQVVPYYFEHGCTPMGPE